MPKTGHWIEGQGCGREVEVGHSLTDMTLFEIVLFVQPSLLSSPHHTLYYYCHREQHRLDFYRNC